MSITEVRKITCDFCGYAEEIGASHNNAARVMALRNGWKFMAYQGLMPGTVTKSNGRQASAKQVDACPNCELPMPDELAQALRKADR